MIHPEIGLTEEALAAFCRRWKIVEFALFGSVLREDFGPESDLDVMVTYATDVEWGLFDHVGMEQELAELVGRPVDVLTRRSVEQSYNWLLRETILGTAEVVYAEG